MISLAMLFKGAACPRPQRQREERCDRFAAARRGVRCDCCETCERERDVTGERGGGLGEGQGLVMCAGSKAVQL
jgi:hypothetical protein